jgi:hypothetical protein
MPKSKAFKELMSSVKKTYWGEPVPKKYQKDYGKIYNKNDLEELGIRIAKSKGIKIDKGGKK